MRSAFRWIEPGYVGLIHVLAGISVLLFMIVTGWIALEVLSRVVGFGSMLGVVDFTEYAIYSIALLAAPWVLYKNAHVRVQILSDVLPAVWRDRLRMLTDALCVVVSAVLTYYAFGNFLDSLRRDELIFGELIIPEWWVQWQAPAALLLLTVGFVREIALVAAGSLDDDQIVKE